MPVGAVVVAILLGSLFAGPLGRDSAEADGSGGSFECVYLMGEQGTIQQYDSSFDLCNSGLVRGITRPAMVTCAEITPDGSRLLIGVVRPANPIVLVSTNDLAAVERPQLSLPRPTGSFAHHDPICLFAVTSRHVFYGDLGYFAEPKPFDWMLVDLELGTVGILRDGPLGMSSKDRVAVSPDRRRVLVDTGKYLRLLDASTGATIANVRKTPDGWPSTETMEVDWTDLEVDLTCRMYSNDREPEYVRLLADMATGIVRAEPMKATDRNAADIRGRTRDMLIAYGAGLGRQGRTLPILDDRARQAMSRLGPSSLDAMSPQPSIVYLSPCGRYLLDASAHEANSTDEQSEAGTRSTVTVIDLDSGLVAREILFPEPLVTSLFH